MDISPKLARLLDNVGLERRRSTSSVLLSTVGIFAIGTIVGSVLGVLFAPAAGKKTRDEVLHRLRQRFHIPTEKSENGQNASA